MLYVYVLPGCPYCKNTMNLVKKYKLKHKFIIVKPNDKLKYNKKHKMKTYPQVILNYDRKKIIIGGNNEFEKYIKLSNLIKKNNYNINVLDFILSMNN